MVNSYQRSKLTLSPNRDPWEAQPRETPAAYASFTVYRDMPAGERTLAKVSAVTGRTRGQLVNWSGLNLWVERALAWDEEQDRIRRAAKVAELEAMGKRQAAAGALMQTKGLAKVRSYVDRYDRDGVGPVELKQGQMYTDMLSMDEASRLIEIGVRLERVGRGEGDPYTPQPARTTVNIEQASITQVNQIALGAFMRDNPTKVGQIVELLSGLAEVVAPGAEPKQVTPPDEEEVQS